MLSKQRVNFSNSLVDSDSLQVGLGRALIQHIVKSERRFSQPNLLRRLSGSEVAESAKARKKEIRASSHRDKLRQSSNTLSQPAFFR